MIRVLVLIAVTGFLVSIVALTAAFALGGPEAIARGAWSIGSRGCGRMASTPRYQKKITSSGGMLRNTST